MGECSPEIIKQCCPVVKKKTKGKRRINPWNCYLRHCAKAENQTVRTCMSDKEAKKEYTNNKEKWVALAKSGCK